MAEGQMGAKEKGVSSDDINNLSDSAYQNLLDEALNIKSVSLHNKSPMMQTLLKEVAIDDDDFPSNVREMVDAMTEGNNSSANASNKKLRSSDRRRAKDDQHRVHNTSAAARNSQGGSLQNLSGCGSRKSDFLGGGEGRGRGRLQKSESINSVIADKLDLMSGSNNNKLKARSRSQGVSESEAEESVKIKKCNYGSLSFDSATRTRCCQKQTRRKSTPGDLVTSSGVGGEVVEGRWTLPGPGEEIEMMEIDHSDDDCAPHEKTPLLKMAAGGPMKVGVGRKNNSCVVVGSDGDCVMSSSAASESHVEVDKVIAMPFQKEASVGKSSSNGSVGGCHGDEINGDAKREKSVGKYGDGPQILSGQSFLNLIMSKTDYNYQRDYDHDNIVGNWSGCNSTMATAEKHSLSQQNKKKKNLKSDMATIEFNHSDGKVRSQLDVNGNPLEEQSRNLLLQNTIQRSRFNQEIVELNRITTSATMGDSDKRRKHKRTKANNTLKEMKAGEIQGNRGLDSLDSLVAFINSSDKKSSTVKTPDMSTVVTTTTTTTTNSKTLSLTSTTMTATKNNNKVNQSAKAKKQEKENNKRNLPTTVSLVDGSVIKNGGQTSEQCDNDDSSSIYDLLKIESLVDKIHRNAAHEPVMPNALEEHVNGTIKVQMVRKAHSWEGASLPNSIPVGKTFSLEGELMEVSCDGGVVLVPTSTSCEPNVISSFVSDFYAMAEVPQVVEESEFHVVLPKKFRRNNNRYLSSRGGDSGNSREERRERGDFESFSTTSSGDDCNRRSSSKNNHHRWNYSGQDEMMLLAGLPIGHHHHRGQRGSADSRRKSTSSMPPSDHSSVDNSDLDSVHSLPVKSTTVKPTIAKTSSSSSSTPQASYADIAKMAAASFVSRNTLAAPRGGGGGEVVELKEVSLPPRNLTLPRRYVKGNGGKSVMLSKNKSKKDASTCTTDDIPTTRSTTPPQQITHWASYPTLAEATGKTDPNSTSTVVSDNKSNDSSSPSKESDSGSSNVPNTTATMTSTTTSSSSPESTDSASAVSTGDRRSGGGSGDSVSTHYTGVGNVSRKSKDDEEENNTSTTSSSPPTTTTTTTANDTEKDNSSQVTTKRKKEMASNSSSSEASASSEIAVVKMSTKPTKRTTTSTMKNLPAVVIMNNNYKPGPCQVDVSFGFEVNELLLQSSSISGSENPSSSSDDQGTAKGNMNTIAAAASAAAAVATVVVPSSASPACVMDASAETSSSSTSPDLTTTTKSGSSREQREAEETINFNYSNIVDFFMQSWDGVVKEIEKEKGSGFRHVKYHSNN